MNKKLIKEAIEQAKMHISYDEWPSVCDLLDEAIAELDKPKYFPLGQEPVNQQCLSCRLNCPNDCPLDMVEQKKSHGCHDCGNRDCKDGIYCELSKWIPT